MLVGGTDGNIVVWDLPESINYIDLNALYKIKLSRECINGISLHKSLPIIATSSGQRLCDSTTKYRDNNVRLWYFS